MTLIRKVLSVCLFFVRMQIVILVYINHDFNDVFAIALPLIG